MRDSGGLTFSAAPIADIDDRTLDHLVAFLDGFIDDRVDSLWSRQLFRWKLGPDARDGVFAWASEGDHVVATVTLTRRELWHRGQRITAAEIGDGYTSPVRQGRGLFSRVLPLAAEHMRNRGVTLLYGTPNERSRRPLVHNLGLLEHPRGLEVFECPAVQLSKLARRTQDFAPLSAKAVRDAEALAEDQREAGFAIVRDGAFVRHRFVDNPLASYLLYAVGSRGWAAYRVHVVFPGRRDLTLADWLLESPQDLEAVVRHAAGVALEAGCHLVSAWSPAGSRAAAVFRRCGFAPAWSGALVLSNDKVGRRLARGTDELVFTIASSDNV